MNMQAMSPKHNSFVVQPITLSTGVTLQYVEQGDPCGLPIVFLHGYTDSWRSFEHVLPHLPPTVRAFALTQRGHGNAERPSGGYRLSDFSADVAAFLDAVGLESAIIAGSSMGASVAQRFAIDYPERVRALVLLSTFGRYRGNPVIDEFWESGVSTLEDPIDLDFAREFQETTLANPIDPDYLDVIVRESLKVPARVWRAAFAGFLQDEFPKELSKIATPTLLIWGDQDVFVPFADQEMMAGTIPGARLLVYRGIGHALHWEEPQRFVADMMRFVQRLTETTSLAAD